MHITIQEAVDKCQKQGMKEFTQTLKEFEKEFEYLPSLKAKDAKYLFDRCSEIFRSHWTKEENIDGAGSKRWFLKDFFVSPDLLKAWSAELSGRSLSWAPSANYPPFCRISPP